MLFGPVAGEQRKLDFAQFASRIPRRVDIPASTLYPTSPVNNGQMLSRFRRRLND
jgi:hypothetical protein